MEMEKIVNLKDQEIELDLEVYEVDSSTVLENMGASNGTNSCSVVISR